MKLRTLITVLVAIVFAASGAYFSAYFSDAHAQKSHPGNFLYNSKLTPVPDNGKQPPLSEYQGHVLVVNFWAHWCGPCRAEMPDLNKLHHELASKGVKFIGISIDDDLKAAEAFIHARKVTYPNYLGDSTGDLYKALDVGSSIPYTLVLNKSGEIVQSFHGIVNIDDLRKVILSAN